MIAAVVNVKRYDWATWLIGMQKSFISGAAGAAVNTSATMGIDPATFNLGAGLRRTILLAVLSAAGSGIIHMMVFLQTHPAPDPVGEAVSALPPPIQSGNAATTTQRGWPPNKQ